MDEFMKIVLSLSISGTLLLLLILGFKPLYKNKFSRRWQYYIWIIVVLRFLLPFTPDTINVGSLFQLFRTVVITNENSAGSKLSAVVNTDNNEPIRSQVLENENIIVNNAAKQKLFDRYACLFFIWSVFAVVLFVRKVTIYQGFIQYMKVGNTEISDVKILNLLSDLEERQSMKTRVELYSNSLISSPIMIGFFRPSIILPVREWKEKELSYIFMHELNHYKRRDMFYKWLIQLVICIHWFNPFVYLLEKEVNKACELSCDEAVIAMLDDSVRREYGDVLLLFLKIDHLRKGSFTSVTLTEGAKQLKERLGAIMNFKKKTKTVRIFTGISTLCLLFGAAFVGVYPTASANHSDPAEKSEILISEQKRHEMDSYVSDKNLDIGWNGNNKNWNFGWEVGNWNHKDWAFDWEDEDWNDEDWGVDWDDGDWNDEDWGVDWDDGDWNDEDWEFDWDDKDWDWDDTALIEEYAAYGIEKNGKSYYYQGELINIIKDQRPDSSFYMLDINSKGTTSIKIIRNAEGEITGVSYMTEEEITELLERAVGETEEIPVSNER